MTKTAVRFLPAFASLMLATGAAHAVATPSQAGWEEVGEASWYGSYHNGRRTSSGTIFNMNEMTAAHATLPLGSKIRVTVQETGASVVVTVTDRQPAKYVRVIDLSRGAASRVGILSRGTAMVTLSSASASEPIEVAEATPGEQYEGPVSGASPRRHGRLHTRPGVRSAAAVRPSSREPSVIRVRHSVQHQAARHTL